MHLLDELDAVSDWAIEFPEAIRLFERYEIDYACGGRSLQHLCEQKGLSAVSLINEIRSLKDDSSSDS